MPRTYRRAVDAGRVKQNSRIQRIILGQNPERPILVRRRSVIRRSALKNNPSWWILHRRGFRRPRVGVDPLEARAVSKDMIRGTLPERILYRWLINHYFTPDVDFDFQSCLTKGHRVLTSDLRWLPVEELKPGDTLLNFSENTIPPRNGKNTPRTNRRYFETGTVLTNNKGTEECIRVQLSNGTTITATTNHPWLVLGRRSQKRGMISRADSVTWAHTDELKPGMIVPKYLPVWEEDTTKEAGYIAGFFDADGNICHKLKKNRNNGITATFAQQEGQELSRIKEALIARSIPFRESVNHDPRGKNPMHILTINGGRANTLEFLGKIRPQKLMHQLEIDRLGRIDKIEVLTITEVQPVGPQEIYRLGVSNHTYFAEGLGMHNSLEGGRLELGGMVVDYLFPYHKLVIQVDGPTHFQHGRGRKDDEQRMILEAMGYRVEALAMDLIYDEPRFEDEMRRIFRLGYYGRGQVYSGQTMGETIDPESQQLAVLGARVDRLFLRVQEYVLSQQ